MDLVVPALFLVLGFSVVLLVGGVVKWSRTSGVPKGLSVEDGVVKLDRMGKRGASQPAAAVAQRESALSPDRGSQIEGPAARPRSTRKVGRRGK